MKWPRAWQFIPWTWKYISTHRIWSAVIAAVISGIILTSLKPWLEEERITIPQKPVHTHQISPTPALKALEAYCKRLKDLDGRFFDRDEFIKNMIGKKVEWTGFVFNVMERSEDIILTISSDLDSLNCNAHFSFKEEKNITKLYSLLPKDKVRVIGIYKYGGSPELEGIDFERLDN
jgi:hypothetical protein